MIGYEQGFLDESFLDSNRPTATPHKPALQPIIEERSIHMHVSVHVPIHMRMHMSIHMHMIQFAYTCV